MTVLVVPYSTEWPLQFEQVAEALRTALRRVPIIAIEHVGSTAVPGLAAKPVLDIDVIVERSAVSAALHALGAEGYVHRGDLGVTDREALVAPDDEPRRNVYVCVAGTLHLRNHLAVRQVLRTDTDLRDRYGALKVELAKDPEISIGRYIAGKSAVLQDVLEASDLTTDEKRLIYDLNTNL